MQLPYNLYYRQYGIRRLQGMINPNPLVLVSLPRDSMIHFASNDVDHFDLDTSKLYLGSGIKKAYIDFPDTLTVNTHMCSKRQVMLKEEFKGFLQRNKKFRYIREHYLKVKDAQALFVENYSYLGKIYKYPEMPSTPYYKWWNVQRTIWDNVELIASKIIKNHLMFVNVPDNIPSFSMLNLCLTKNPVGIMTLLHDQDSLFLLEMWKWLASTDRKSTIFGNLSDGTLNQVTIVFNTKDGKSTLINLGYLNSWISGNANTTDTGTVSQLPVGNIQKVFLKLLMTLQASNIPVPLVLEAGDLQEAVKDPLDTEEAQDIEDEAKEYHEDHDDDTEDVVDPHEYQLASQASKVPAPKEARLTEAEVELSSNISISDLDLDRELKSIDDDLKVLEDLNTNRLKEKGIMIDAKGEVVEENIMEEEVPLEVINEKIYGYVTPEDALKQQVGVQADYGLLSASDYKKFMNDIEARGNSFDPYDSGLRLKDAKVVTTEDLKLDNVKTSMVVSSLVQDESMKNSSLLSMDKDYITKVMPKDMLAMVDSIQKAGVLVKSHEIEREHSVLGTYDRHTLQLKPVDGQMSTISFKVPQISEDGTFIANGNKMVQRKQRVDNPIRKINPYTVALTSYYGKTFVTLNPKKANSSLEWIIKQLNLASMEDHPYITRVAPAKVFDSEFKAPYIYNALADNFKSITTTRFTLGFSHPERALFCNGKLLEEYEEDGSRVVGRTNKKETIVVNKDNDFYAVDSSGNRSIMGDIYDILELDEQRAPVDFTEVRIFSKNVPVGLILGYSIGFKNLLKLLKAKYRVIEGRRSKGLEKYEYSISFKDMTYILSKKDKVSSMILAGYLEYERQLKQYDVKEFNHKDVYLNLLESKGLASVYMREIDLTQQLFVDSITKGVLESMGEPVTFNGLLIRSSEMLLDYHHPVSQDMNSMRIRGYERVAGAVYKELTVAIRQYRNKNISGKSKIDMSPYQVWSGIMKDPAMKLVEDINPIQNLKETEIVTYVGEGGRGKESMNKSSRAYHVNDMNIISEATVDSGDVGINAYLSANPRFKDLRGMPDFTPQSKITPSSLISTSALLAPGSDHDDGKRVNFVSIQQGHCISTAGAHPPVIRTGYEYVIANRTSEMFSYTARQDGKVMSMSEKGIVVEYADGTQKGITLGRTYGKAEGSIYPHDIVSDMKEGQKFVKGDPIAYNSGFFEKDYLDPTKIIMKNSMLVTTALYESSQTHEDSCSITRDLSKRMSAKTTKLKSFTINFTQNLLNVVKPGQSVGPKDYLMIIEDEITATSNAFDEASLQSLLKLSNQAPKAGYLGTIDKIEVFYHGDKADMSASLKAITDRSDKVLSDNAKATGKPVVTGRVTSDYRVSGVPLSLDKAEVRIYITIETSAGVGDKGVFANQLKSVIGEVMDYEMTTESGIKVDAIFGFRSILARIVTSPIIMGTSATLLKLIGKKAVEAYRSK